MNFSSGNLFLYFCGLNFGLSLLVTVCSLLTPFAYFSGIFSSVLLFLNSIFYLEILKRKESCNILDDSKKSDSSQIDPA